MRKSVTRRPIRLALVAPLLILTAATLAVTLVAALNGAGALAVVAIVAFGICSTVVVVPAALLISFRADRAAVARQRAAEAKARAAAAEAEKAYRAANSGPLGFMRRGLHKVVGRPVPQAQTIVDSFAFPSRGGYSNPYSAPFAHHRDDGGWDTFAPASMLLTAVAIETVL